MTEPHKDVLDTILKEHLKQCFVTEIMTDPYLSEVFNIVSNHMTEEEALICVHEISHINVSDAFFVSVETRDDFDGE